MKLGFRRKFENGIWNFLWWL